VKPAGKPAGIFRLEGTAAVWAAGALVGVGGSEAQYMARAWMSSSLRPAAVGFMEALLRLLALKGCRWPFRERGFGPARLGVAGELLIPAGPWQAPQAAA